MWDDAQALRRLGNALFGISLALVLYGLVHYMVHLPVFAVKVVQLQEQPVHVDVTQVSSVLRNELYGNFFTMDLTHVRKALEQLPWVQSASVQRHFPWQLDVKLEEDQALASWNGTGLVNVQGDLFNSGDTKPGTGLPAFSGPDNTAPEVTQYYRSFSSELAPIGLAITQISLTPRMAWHLQLQNGMLLKLGREQMEQRLARFVAAYPGSLANMQPPARYVDLRYRNGFAAGMAG